VPCRAGLGGGWGRGFVHVTMEMRGGRRGRVRSGWWGGGGEKSAATAREWGCTANGPLGTAGLLCDGKGAGGGGGLPTACDGACVALLCRFRRRDRCKGIAVRQAVALGCEVTILTLSNPPPLPPQVTAFMTSTGGNCIQWPTSVRCTYTIPQVSALGTGRGGGRCPWDVRRWQGRHVICRARA
jgi:hypothetical protein